MPIFEEVKSHARGGARPGAGRKPGGRNLITREAIAKAGNGMSPLDYLLRVMSDETEASDRRLDAARAAAPYCHARLQPINSDGDSDRKYVFSALAWTPPD